MGKNKAFNINSFERSTFSFTDKGDKVLLVRMPRKQVFDRMNDMRELNGGGAKFDNVDETLSEIIAEILSNNKQGKEITASEIAASYDFEEKLEIFYQYMDFVKGSTSDPN